MVPSYTGNCDSPLRRVKVRDVEGRGARLHRLDVDAWCYQVLRRQAAELQGVSLNSLGRLGVDGASRFDECRARAISSCGLRATPRCSTGLQVALAQRTSWRCC